MSLQVGNTCYLSPVDAGAAACSQFSPISTINSVSVKQVTCSSADATTGALNLFVTSTDLTTNVTTSQTVQQVLSFPPCIQTDYFDAFEVVFGAVLGLYVIWLCSWKLLSYLGWSRGENV